MSTRFAAAVAVGLFVSSGAGARAWAQNVRVDSEPSRATLVCDGTVVGVTPTLFNPNAVRTCTLFASGHANLAFDPSELSGVVARFRLTPIEPPRVSATPPRDERPPRAQCGQVDPVTGLVVVCFHQRPDAGAVRTPPVAPPVAPPTEANNRASRRCGHFDPHTRLLVPCFDPPASSARPPAPPRDESAQRQGGRRCGYLDPATHLLVPCF